MQKLMESPHHPEAWGTSTKSESGQEGELRFVPNVQAPAIIPHCLLSGETSVAEPCGASGEGWSCICRGAGGKGLKTPARHMEEPGVQAKNSREPWRGLLLENSVTRSVSQDEPCRDGQSRN